MESLHDNNQHMTPERWQRLKSLFGQAIDLDPVQQALFMHALGVEDAQLEGSLRSLIGHHGAAASLLDGPMISSQRVAEYLSAGVRTFQKDEVVANRFRIDRFIGEGGMGEVYAAEDLDLGEKVALKTLRPTLSANDELLLQFKREIQMARKVTHNNVSRVFDLFWHQAADKSHGRMTAFLTMELLEGETLGEHIQRSGRMPEREALCVAEQVTLGLSAAHSAGIVHRDFKSGNILLVERPDGHLRAVITDFGLASYLEGALPVANGAQAIAGTLAYMAPEQLQGSIANSSADIYALGVVLFEMVTGQLPFSQTTVWEMARSNSWKRAPSPRDLVPGLDRRWEAAIVACLNSEPKLRPETAMEVLEHIRSQFNPSRRQVSAALAGGVATAAVGWLWLRPKPINPEALMSLKRGTEFAQRRNEQGLRNAVVEFRRAVTLEPRYAAAWVGLADSYSAMANFNIMSPKEALAKAQEAALQALAIDRKLGKAAGVMGYVTSLDVHNWLKAETYFRQAIATDPRDPAIRLWYGAHLGKLGRSRNAFEQLRLGLEQAPSSFILNQQLTVELFRARRFEEFYQQARELVRLQPFEASSHLALARALEWQGRYEEALGSCAEADKYNNSVTALCFRGSIEAARGNVEAARRIAVRIRQYWTSQPFQTVLLASLYARLGEHAIVVELLNDGYDREDSTVLTCATNPYMDGMREDPDYRRFLTRIDWPAATSR
jgi:serine/threonine protein kinase/Tfp pilus assembly protein PilF